MKIALIGPREYRPLKWKNGGGNTLELFNSSREECSDLSSIRISIADIEKDSLFSTFENTDRTSILIEGLSVVLSGASHELKRLRAKYDSYSYAGSENIEAILPHGKVRLFNVFTDSLNYEHSFLVLKNGAGNFETKGGERLFVYGVGGESVLISPDHCQVDVKENALLLIKFSDKGCWRISGEMIVVVVRDKKEEL